MSTLPKCQRYFFFWLLFAAILFASFPSFFDHSLWVLKKPPMVCLNSPNEHEAQSSRVVIDTVENCDFCVKPYHDYYEWIIRYSLFNLLGKLTMFYYSKVKYFVYCSVREFMKILLKSYKRCLLFIIFATGLEKHIICSCSFLTVRGLF